MKTPEVRKKQGDFARAYWTLENRLLASKARKARFAKPEIYADHLAKFAKPVLIHGLREESLAAAGIAFGVTKVAIRESIKRRRAGFEWAAT